MGVNWTVDAARPHDGWVLSQRLRQRDRDEAVAACGPDVRQSLTAAIEASTGLCWGARTNRDGLVFLIGCAKHPGRADTGSPWLMGAKAADLYPGALTKITKRHIGLMLEVYSTLVNYVDARNEDSVRWLDRLGFKIEPAEAYGVEGRPFHRFTMGL